MGMSEGACVSPRPFSVLSRAGPLCARWLNTERGQGGDRGLPDGAGPLFAGAPPPLAPGISGNPDAPPPLLPRTVVCAEIALRPPKDETSTGADESSPPAGAACGGPVAEEWERGGRPEAPGAGGSREPDGGVGEKGWEAPLGWWATWECWWGCGWPPLGGRMLGLLFPGVRPSLLGTPCSTPLLMAHGDGGPPLPPLPPLRPVGVVGPDSAPAVQDESPPLPYDNSAPLPCPSASFVPASSPRSSSDPTAAPPAAAFAPACNRPLTSSGTTLPCNPDPTDVGETATDSPAGRRVPAVVPTTPKPPPSPPPACPPPPPACNPPPAPDPEPPLPPAPPCRLPSCRLALRRSAEAPPLQLLLQPQAANARLRGSKVIVAYSTPAGKSSGFGEACGTKAPGGGPAR